MSNIETQFEKVVNDYHRKAFIEVVKQKPNATIKDLYDLSEKHNLTDLTLSEILSAEMKKRPARAKKDSQSVDVRTPAARRAYDEKVLSVVKNADGDYVSAKQVRESAGGTPLQVRKALARLIEQGKLTFKGKARATRYAVTE